MNQAKEKYNQRAQKTNSIVCVGLDPDIEKLPERFKKLEFPFFEFGKYIVEETAEFVSAFKPNPAFYEARGEQGMRELKMLCDYITQNFPEIFLILDSKRGDIGNTNIGYVKEAFEWAGADAVTVSPYLGKEALEPYFKYIDKCIIVLARTSNSGAGEFQDLKVGEKKLWEIVTDRVVNDWNKNHNCMLVVGAPYPEELAKARKIAGEMTFLVPGIGAQGGSVEAIVKAGLNSKKLGMIVNSSRGIIFAENPREEAKKLRDEINKWR